MNKKIDPGSMISSKGYAVERLNRHQLKYSYENKVLTLTVEPSTESMGSINRPFFGSSEKYLSGKGGFCKI